MEVYAYGYIKGVIMMLLDFQTIFLIYKDIG